jgi:hypothetical protein
MRQRCDRLRFSIEPLSELGISGEAFMQNLYRDDAIEAGVLRSIHVTHTARADCGLDFVRPERGADRERHKSEGSTHHIAKINATRRAALLRSRSCGAIVQ